MVDLGVSSRAASRSHFYSRHCEIDFFKSRRRARIDAEIDHREVTSSRLRFLNAQMPGIPTSYLRASSDTIQHDRETHKRKSSTRAARHGLGISRRFSADFRRFYTFPPMFYRRRRHCRCRLCVFAAAEKLVHGGFRDACARLLDDARRRGAADVIDARTRAGNTALMFAAEAVVN